jgi:hypothetical protein
MAGLLDTIKDKAKQVYQQGLLNQVITNPASVGQELSQLFDPSYMSQVNPMSQETAFDVAMSAPMMALTTSGKLSDVVSDYAMQHRPPMKGNGAPLYDLTGKGEFYPSDVYSNKAVQYYGTGVPYDNEAFAIAQKYKDKPDALVTMYRAVPKQLSIEKQIAQLEKQKAAFLKRGNVPPESNLKGSDWYNYASNKLEELKSMPIENYTKPTINSGDWVTLTKQYAKEHGEANLNNNYQILSKKVPSKKLFTNADSIHEFGYDEAGKITPQMLGTLGLLSGTGVGFGYYTKDKEKLLK